MLYSSMDTLPTTHLPMCQIQGDRVSGLKFFESASLILYYRRRSLQYHYASSECQFITCPKSDDTTAVDPSPQPGPEGPKYFDCDPSCAEKKYYYYKKGELLVTGRDFGEGYI